MSTPINDGGPAFPGSHWVESESPMQRNLVFDPGQSLRDYFAYGAMSGICAANPTADFTDDKIAQHAFALADAMLRARSK